jgi:hypothetical protein
MNLLQFILSITQRKKRNIKKSTGLNKKLIHNKLF